MIHQLAHHLAIPTVAEGVETAEQIEHLRDIGCDALQGYLFSRPLEHDELVRWVRSRVGTRTRARVVRWPKPRESSSLTDGSHRQELGISGPLPPGGAGRARRGGSGRDRCA